METMELEEIPPIRAGERLVVHMKRGMSLTGKVGGLTAQTLILRDVRCGWKGQHWGTPLMPSIGIPRSQIKDLERLDNH